MGIFTNSVSVIHNSGCLTGRGLVEAELKFQCFIFNQILLLHATQPEWLQMISDITEVCGTIEVVCVGSLLFAKVYTKLGIFN